MDLLNTSFPIGSEEWLRQVVQAIQELYDKANYDEEDLSAYKSETNGTLSSLGTQVETLNTQVDGILNP